VLDHGGFYELKKLEFEERKFPKSHLCHPTINYSWKAAAGSHKIMASGPLGCFNVRFPCT
jgi:hypothetical protein